MAVQSVAATQDGRLAQLVRALPSHGRGQRFKSFVAHHSFSFSHYRSRTRSCPATFVLNLLFRSKWKQGFEIQHGTILVQEERSCIVLQWRACCAPSSF